MVKSSSARQGRCRDEASCLLAGQLSATFWRIVYRVQQGLWLLGMYLRSGTRLSALSLESTNSLLSGTLSIQLATCIATCCIPPFRALPVVLAVVHKVYNVMG